jgi:NAD(P)-dependent dehydrogenase (short-subunit alcohol dehydrogenase family)
MSVEEWDRMFQINVRGMFFIMQQVVEQSMQHLGGAIVNFSSMAGIRGMRETMASPHYSASKGAVVAMTMQAATEWAKYGVRCNAVAPGGVLTKAMATLDFPKDALEPVPLHKLSKPEDIANAVTFLASEKAAMITGQTLVIDGGSSVVGY